METQSRPVRAFHNDPYNPTLFSPDSKALDVSPEQERLIREVHMLGSSDTRFAQKMSDAVLHILRTGSTVKPVIESLSPENTTIGSESFDIHVVGTGFDETSTILFNGYEEPTTFNSETDVSTGVNMPLWAAPVVVPVMVRNSTGALSNTVPFEFLDTPARTREKEEKSRREFEVLKKDDRQSALSNEQKRKEEQDRRLQETLKKIEEDRTIHEKKGQEKK